MMYVYCSSYATLFAFGYHIEVTVHHIALNGTVSLINKGGVALDFTFGGESK